MKNKGVAEAFASLERNRQKYFEQVGKMFQDTFAETRGTGFVFIKPESVGATQALRIADPVLSQIYGTQFEKHTLAKGLFQLAKSSLAETPGASPYTFGGSLAPISFTDRLNTGMRIGVVETKTQGQLLNLFGEGGLLFTPKGAEKFARRLPAGSLYISGPSLETLSSVEKLFGLNLAAGDLQNFSDPLRLVRSLETQEARLQLEAALGVKEGGQAGFLRQLYNEGGGTIGLSKIERTDVGLRLDFATTEKQVAETTEMLLGARRHSGILTDASHPLHGFLKGTTLRNMGVDALMSVDEFNKTLGPQVYVSNYIDQVSKRADAAEIFKTVFGHHGWKRGDQVVFNYNFDSAFERARRSVGYLRGLGADADTKLSGRELVRRIRQGESLTIGKGLERVGATGVRVFGMTGSFRTDFMGDINMMNPLRMTAAKMVSLSSGYQSLGYGTALDDPLVDIFSRSSRDWRGKGPNFSIDPDTGRLKIGPNNLIRRFAEVISGTGTLTPSQKATFSGVNAIISKDGLSIQGKKLSLLPDLKQFAYSEGGVPLSQLKNTILDPSRDMIYLDLGKRVDIDIAGKKIGMQQLPIPVGLLRKAKGPYERITIGTADPAFEFVDAVRELEQSLDFDNLRPGEAAADRLKGKDLAKFTTAYNKVIQSLLGKEGLATQTSSILMYGGTRARLAPSKTDFFFGERRPRIEQLLTAEVKGSELYDFFKKKASAIDPTGRGKFGNIRSQFDYIEKAIKEGKKDIFVMLSADPAQRAEHFQVMKLHITGDYAPGKVTQKLGQLNVSVSPMWMKLMERDLDRDVVNFLPLTGMNVEGKTREELQKALADRYDRQSKLLKHYVHLYGAELDEVAEEKLASRRLGGKLRAGLIAGKEALKNIGQTLMAYEGGQKSLGYTIARSGEDLMVTLAGRVSKLSSVDDIDNALLAGMKELGSTDIGGLKASMFEQFVGDEGGRRLSASRQALQALYQGAVQKAGEKGGLEGLGKTIALVGESITENKFNYADSLARIEQDVESIILQQEKSNKLRAFYDLDYLSDQNKSLKLMMADLEAGTGDLLNLTKGIKKEVIKEQSKLIAEFLLPGIVARKTGASVSMAENILRGRTGDEAEQNFNKLLRGLGIQVSGGLEDTVVAGTEAAEAAEKKLLAKNSQLSKNVFSSFLDFMSKSSGKAFAGGIGVGVVAATAIRSLMSDEAPMPRDIDVRQPTDQGPEIFSAAPRIYGSSSPMHASRSRSPVSLGMVDGYSMYSASSPQITISDKRSRIDPRLLDSHIRSVAHSDYTY